MPKISFFQYCKANPMWFVGIVIFSVLATVSFLLGEAGGILAGCFFCFSGAALIIGQVLSYRKLP